MQIRSGNFKFEFKPNNIVKISMNVGKEKVILDGSWIESGAKVTVFDEHHEVLCNFEILDKKSSKIMSRGLFN